MPVLIRALEQGAEGFSERERGVVMNKGEIGKGEGEKGEERGGRGRGGKGR